MPLHDLRKHSNMWSLKETFCKGGHGVVMVKMLVVML